MPAGRITWDAPSYWRQVQMGDGAKSLMLLGVTQDNAAQTMPAIAKFIETLSRKVQAKDFSIHPATLPITACEAERRGAMCAGVTFASAIRHRSGL